MGHATGTRISQNEIETLEVSFNSLTAIYFIFLLSEKVYFKAKIFDMHIIYVRLTCM